MAPRRSVKSVRVTNNNNNYNNLTLSDVLCPICRSILIEPVSLPCTHRFCSSCFESVVANTNLVCPLCRVRIGSWLRTSRRDNKLINGVLWEAIQKRFPEQIKNKQRGVEEYLPEDIPRLLTEPGEIRREYEAQKLQDELELQEQHKTETKASEVYIKKLKEQEEHDKAAREENLRLSEHVALKLSREYCFDPGPSSSKSDVRKQGPIDRLLKNMSQKKVTVTLQNNPESVKEYTCKILCQDKNLIENRAVDKVAFLNRKMKEKLKKIIVEGEASDSNDSIDSECRYFKPIEQRYMPLTKQVPIVKVPAILRTANTVIIGPPKGQTNFIHAPFGSAFAIVKLVTIPINTAEKETTIRKSNSEFTITELPTICSQEKKYDVRHRIQQKKEDKPRNEISFVTPSRRKRQRSSPYKLTSSKRSNQRVDSPPCRGFDRKNINKCETKVNGVTHSIKNVKNNLKQLQEEEDLKFAKQLHEQLNNRGRYLTRNSISVQIKNVKKAPKRQVTLKEMMSHTVSKIP